MFSRYFVVLFVLIFSNNVLANVSFNFNSMPLSEVSQAFFKGVLKKDFVMSSDLLSDTRLVTINIKDIESDNLLSTVSNILRSQGVDFKEVDNVFYLTKFNASTAIQTESIDANNQLPIETVVLPFDSPKPVLYVPIYRTVSELSEVLSIFNISAFTRNNDFLVFNVADSQKDNVLDILAKIDLPVTQYEVIAATYEVNKRDDSQRSIDIIGDIFKNIGISLLTSGASNVLKFTGSSLTTAFKFFDTDTRFRSIVKPYGVVKSGGNLNFTSGQDVPVLGNITTNNSVSQQSIEYRQSGVILNVGLIASKDSIDIKINHELSNFIQTRIGVNTSPTLNKQSIKTSVSVKDGEILVLGGLTDKSGSFSSSNVLGLFPVEQTKTTQDKETFIFLQVNKI